MSYKILFKQCGSDHYTKGRSGHSISHIAMHYTSTKASAKNNAVYFARNENQGASAHYFVDDISEEIYQSVKDADTAWAVGDWTMNCKSISIEVVSAGENFSATEIKKAVWLVQKLQAKYGIPDSNVIRHYDVSGKLCPKPYIDASKWSNLRKQLTGGSTSGGAKKSISQLAKEVIEGKWGNDPERSKKLKAAGYDAEAVQAEVNRQLGVSSGGSSSSSGSSVKVGAKVKLKKQVDYNGTSLNMPGTYTVSEVNGDRVVVNSGSTVMAAVKKSNLTVVSGGGASSGGSKSWKVGAKVKVTNPYDENGTHLAVSGTYTVMEISGNRVVIGKGGVVTAAMPKGNLRLV